MDFSLTDEQVDLKRAAAEFAQRELTADPVLLQGDWDAEATRANWRKCADFGIQGLPMPEQLGGSSVDQLTALMAMEGLGYGCRDNGLLFAINAQMWSVQIPILRFGSPAQQEQYLPKMINGTLIGAHAMTEPGSGSDAFNLSTTASRSGDMYILNGSKTFVSNAPVANVFLIFAATDKSKGLLGITAFLVQRDTPGLSVGAPISKMGLHSSPMAEVFLDDCHVHADNLLGRQGLGARIFQHSMEWERAYILASNIGTMERQLEECVAYATNRRQFGQPIAAFQSISHKIVDMKLRLETARLLLYRAAWKHAQGQDVSLDVSLAKLHISECFVQSSLDAIQIHGGYGYTQEYQAERNLRDAVGGRIYSGTSEIPKNIIARAIGLSSPRASEPLAPNRS